MSITMRAVVGAVMTTGLGSASMLALRDMAAVAPVVPAAISQWTATRALCFPRRRVSRDNQAGVDSLYS